MNKATTFKIKCSDNKCQVILSTAETSGMGHTYDNGGV